MLHLALALLLATAGATDKKDADANRIDLWRDMAQWYIDNHLTEQALEMVSRLREAGEQSPELDLIQARVLVAQGVPDEALHLLEQLVPRMPKDARPLQTLGVVYSDLGDYEKAIASLRRAIELEPNNAATHNNLGFLLMGVGRCADATQALERATELDSSSGRYRNNLAFALVCAGEAQRALKLFRSTGSEADARYNMGLAYERLGSLPSAILQYQEALVADERHAGATEAMARLAPLGLLPGTEPAEGAAP
ncbi:MAG TPA: tetratricopeptide repeat protein [Myxococcota bacterium]|nr:tetratricopeptide repeat protein [Myxococcota bacterium]